MVTGRQQFGDCVAGVPLMYPDRNRFRAERRRLSSLLFICLAPSGFPGPVGLVGESKAIYAAC